MDNLQYIHEQLCYAEDQREQADDMYSMQAWDQRIDALQCAYNSSLTSVSARTHVNPCHKFSLLSTTNDPH